MERIRPVTISRPASPDTSVIAPALVANCGGAWVAAECTLNACTAIPETIAATPQAIMAFPSRGLTCRTRTPGAYAQLSRLSRAGLEPRTAGSGAIDARAPPVAAPERG